MSKPVWRPNQGERRGCYLVNEVLQINVVTEELKRWKNNQKKANDLNVSLFQEAKHFKAIVNTVALRLLFLLISKETCFTEQASFRRPSSSFDETWTSNILSAASGFTVLRTLPLDVHDNSTQTADQLQRFRNDRFQAPGQKNVTLIKVSAFPHFRHVLSLE